MKEVITASGHHNIRSTHKTTWQLTKEDHLTPRGDCIVGVAASHGTRDLSPELKTWLQQGKWVKIILQVGDDRLTGKGMGHPNLTFDDPIDLVFRRSDYTCPRTVTINTTFTANDLPKAMRSELRQPDTSISVIITPLD